MASAHAHTAQPRSSRSTPAPRRNGRVPARAIGPRAAGVRWDRVGRLAMLGVLVALAFLYLSAGIGMFSTWRQSSHDRARVAAMEAEHVDLQRHHEELSRPGALEAQARRLGMIRPGEQPYVISGLPGN